MTPTSSESFLSALLSTLDSLVLVTSQDGTIQCVNQAWQEFWQNRSSKFSTGDNVLDIVNAPHPLNCLDKPIREIVAGQRDAWKSQLDVRTEVETLHFQANVKRVDAVQGKFIMIALDDVSDIKHLESRVTNIARLTAESTNPILQIDRSGTIVYANRSADFLLHQWQTTVGQAVPDTVLAKLEPAFEKCRPQQFSTCVGNRAYEFSVTPVFGRQCFNLYGHETTAAKRIEQQLREAKESAELANRSKSTFLANMSHELRTPLTAILGFADVLESNSLQLTMDERRDALHTIRRNGNHLLDLVNDILDLSKIEANRLELDISNCELPELVEEVRSLLLMKANTKGVAFDVRFENSIPAQIQCDARRLKQILLNIVGNAIKFTNRGRVCLSVGLDSQQELAFVVTDTGVGISPKQQQRLFEPFTQADSSTTRRFGGTGLGLSISKRLCELLGGTIHVSSQPNVGSEFTIRLPATFAPDVRMVSLPREAVRRRSDQSQIHGDTHSSLPLASCRILLAEDGLDNQRLISFVLTKAGAAVDVVENGQLAVDAVREQVASGNAYDVVIMDMQMPVLDGYQATGQLRDDGYQGYIIALTANAMSGDRERCLAAGCDDYAAKPIDKARLISVLQAATATSTTS
ncbi:MAG: ATP-binding protein [Pirellulaceae bacterium]